MFGIERRVQPQLNDFVRPLRKIALNICLKKLPAAATSSSKSAIRGASGSTIHPLAS